MPRSHLRRARARARSLLVAATALAACAAVDTDEAALVSDAVDAAAIAALPGLLGHALESRGDLDPREELWHALAQGLAGDALSERYLARRASSERLRAEGTQMLVESVACEQITPRPERAAALPTASFAASPPTGTFAAALPTASFAAALPTASFAATPPTGSFAAALPTASFAASPPTGSFAASPPTGSFAASPPTGSFAADVTLLARGKVVHGGHTHGRARRVEAQVVVAPTPSGLRLVQLRPTRQAEAVDPLGNGTFDLFAPAVAP